MNEQGTFGFVELEGEGEERERERREAKRIPYRRGGGFTSCGQYVGFIRAVVSGRTTALASGKWLQEMAHMSETGFHNWTRDRGISPVMKFSQNAWFYDYEKALRALRRDGLV